MANRNNLIGFAGPFLQAFTVAQQNKQKNELLKALTETKIKIAKQQAERAVKQQEALGEVGKFLTGTGSAPEDVSFTEAPSGQAQGGNLLDMLSSGEGQNLLLQSGLIKVPQVISGQQAGRTLDQNAALMQQFGIAGAGAGGTEQPVSTTFPATPSQALPAQPQPSAGVSAAPRSQVQLKDVVLQAGKPAAFKLARSGPGAAVKTSRINLNNPRLMDDLDEFGTLIRTRPASPTELGKLDKALGFEGASNLILPDTLESPPAKTTSRQAMEQGAVRVTSKQKESIAAMQNVGAIVDSTKQMSARLITATNPIEAAAQFTKLTLAAKASANAVAAVYEDSKEAFLGVLARALGGERGVLTDRDINRIRKLLPSFGDTAVIRDLKMGLIDNFVLTAQEALRGTLFGIAQPSFYRERMTKLLDAAEAQVKQGGGAVGILADKKEARFQKLMEKKGQ